MALYDLTETELDAVAAGTVVRRANAAAIAQNINNNQNAQVFASFSSFPQAVNEANNVNQAQIRQS